MKSILTTLAVAVLATTATQIFAQEPVKAASPIATPAMAVTPTPPPGPAFAAPNLSPSGVRSLAANCAACHGTNGNSAGGAIPGLAGADKEYLIAQMKLFKDGKRVATLMHQISKGYSDAEVSALADYFAAQKK